MRNGESVDTMKMFLGTTAGTIGETSVIALLIGAVFLILMGVIDLLHPGKLSDHLCCIFTDLQWKRF